MGKHYLPREIQRGFAVPANPKMVCMYDKQDDVFREVAIRTAAQEADYYDDETETVLSEQIEGPANKVLAKLKLKELITLEERQSLATYLAVAMTRSPRYRREALERFPAVVNETTESARAELIELSASCNTPPEIGQMILEDIDRIKDRALREPLNFVGDKVRIPWYTARWLAAINGMAWRALHTNGPDFFITGDSTIYYHTAYGVGQPKSELTFPVSSQLAMFGESQTRPLTLVHQQASGRMVREANRRMIDHAERFIFSHKQHDWIAEIAKKRPLLSRIKWTQ